MLHRLARALGERTDEEIAVMAQKGTSDAEEYLSLKYNPMVRRIARGYFLVGGERKDLEQEGHIGLLEAIRTYSKESTASFRTFAYLCIERQMISAVRAAGRQKHLPLSGYRSLSLEDASVGNPGLLIDPAEEFLQQEKKRLIEECAASRLSSLEKAVLILRLEGKSYQEIAQELHSTTKAVDNAVQRIRKKLKDLSE